MVSPANRTFVAVAITVVISAVAVSPVLAGEVSGARASVRVPETREDPPVARTARQDPDARSPRAEVLRGPYLSVQVNVDEFGQNIVGDAANEPSIAVSAVDPDNLVIGWRQFDSVASNFRQAGRAVTFDRGQTWAFPGPLTPGVFRSDPVLDSDSQGNFYYQSLQEDFDVDVFRSVDGGATWGAPVSAFGGDKNWMVVDKSGGLGDGQVYGIWQRFFGCCGQDTFTRSTDGAQTFETPVAVAFRPTFGTLAVGPDGEVYATGIDGTFFQNFDQFVVAKSEDARDPSATPSFTGSQVELGGSMMFSGGPNPAGLLGQANVAVDRSDGPTRANVYILASVDPPGIDPLDVHLIRSSDGGATWSAPVRVNDDPPGASAWQWFGAHSVAPNGRLDVIWNDTRNSGQTNVSELFYAYSYDAGDTWLGNRPVSPPFDSSLGYPNQSKLGDYYTLVSDSTGADVAYAATFNLEQDVYYLRVFPDCNDNAVSDVSDIEDGTSSDLNGNQIPDECELLLTRPFPGIAGQLNVLFTLGGTPDNLVLLFQGVVAGATPLPGCGGTLDIADPVFAGIGRTGANGASALAANVSPLLGGVEVRYQALELPSCAISEVVLFAYP